MRDRTGPTGPQGSSTLLGEAGCWGVSPASLLHLQIPGTLMTPKTPASTTNHFHVFNWLSLGDVFETSSLKTFHCGAEIKLERAGVCRERKADKMRSRR